MKGRVIQRSRIQRDSWTVIVDLGRKPDGRRNQVSRAFRGTKKQAEAKLAEILHSYENGSYIAPSQTTTGDLLTRWLRDGAKPTVSAKTYERYAEIVEKNIVPALGSIPLLRLQPLHIQQFYSDALSYGRKDGSGGLSRQTVLHYHRVLHKALRQAVRWQMLSRNPADAVDAPSPERKQVSTLTDDSTAALLGKLSNERLCLPVLIAALTGMRRGEILALRWQDVYLACEKPYLVVARTLEQTRDAVRFKYPKSQKSSRRISLPEMLADALRSHREEQKRNAAILGDAYIDTDLICCLADGSIWKPNTFASTYCRRMKALGVRIRFHDLRHTHASQLLQLNIHPKIVSERLGHSTIKLTLDTYSHVLPSMQDEAAVAANAAIEKAIGRLASATASAL